MGRSWKTALSTWSPLIEVTLHLDRFHLLWICVQYAVEEVAQNLQLIEVVELAS